LLCEVIIASGREEFCDVVTYTIKYRNVVTLGVLTCSDQVYEVTKDVKLETTDQTRKFMKDEFDDADWAVRDPKVLKGAYRRLCGDVRYLPDLHGERIQGRKSCCRCDSRRRSQINFDC